MDSYTAWCRDRGCDHAHCPRSCEHPQPFVRDGKLLCGRCWFVCGQAVEMVPCAPDVCD